MNPIKQVLVTIKTEKDGAALQCEGRTQKYLTLEQAVEAAEEHLHSLALTHRVVGLIDIEEG